MNLEMKLAQTDQEKNKIYNLRYSIYVEELGLVPEFANHAEKTLKEPADKYAHNIYAEIDGHMVGAMRLNSKKEGPLEHEKLYDLYKFKPYFPDGVGMATKCVIAKQNRGSFVTKELFRFAYDYIRKNNLCNFIFIDCWPHLINLYEHLGFRQYKTCINHPEAGYMTPMVLVVEDITHLERVGAPMYDIAKKYENPEPLRQFFYRHFEEYAKRPARILLSNEELFDILTTKLSGALDSLNLFKTLTKEEIQQVTAMGNILTCKEGDRIIAFGEVRNEIYTLLSGMVKVVLNNDGAQKVLTTFGRGETFGELAFLAKTARTADVIAVEDCEVLVFDSNTLNKLLSSIPAVAAKIYRNMAEIVALRMVAMQQQTDSLRAGYERKIPVLSRRGPHES
ncbi:MAG: cyclic nucleotide-binding domain-containing protein [Deltaproteobacteria bacterium]|nr:cyclic nucleotide-binding domain-containing protein [Deltaproteobacteria bacterium]